MDTLTSKLDNYIYIILVSRADQVSLHTQLRGQLQQLGDGSHLSIRFYFTIWQQRPNFGLSLPSLATTETKPVSSTSLNPGLASMSQFWISFETENKFDQIFNNIIGNFHSITVCYSITGV